MKKTTRRKSAARNKKPGLISHHKHTGKLLPHKHTSYPLLALILVIAGIFMFGFSSKVRAYDVDVSAIVPGPPPTVPATILLPVNGQTINTTPTTVSGTCQAGDLVKLYRNDIFSGAALCNAGGSFAINTDLFIGINVLNAKVFNLTYVEGPTSPLVTVTYTIPSPPPKPPSPSDGGSKVTPSTPNSSASEPGTQYMIQAENLFKGYYTGDTVVWPLVAIGGQAPYNFDVNWGDGQTSAVVVKESGPFTISHTYKSPGAYKGSYLIKVVGTDTLGAKTYMQLVVIIRDKARSAFAIPATTKTGAVAEPFLLKSYKILVPIYTITVLLVLAFWAEHAGHFRPLKPFKPHTSRRRA